MLKRSIDIGITGTRNGLTEAQWVAMGHLFEAIASEEPIIRHGCCLGVDETAHYLALHYGFQVICHPPDNRKLVFSYWERDATYVHLPKPYLLRNRDIVYNCDILWAFPHTKQMIRRSGTWATIRYAIERRRRHIIVMPDGKREEWLHYPPIGGKL